MVLMVILSLRHRIVEALEALAPVGFEDEKGFHFEDPPQE